MALDSKAIGIGMLAGAGVMLVIAGFTVWNGVNRYMAGSALEKHTAAVFTGDIERARRTAEEAASWMGSDARATLPAIDPRDPESEQALKLLALEVPAAQRPLVLTARNFGRVVRGQALENAEGMRGSDGALVQHLAALRDLKAKPLPPLPESERYQPPNRAILHYTFEQRLQTAWRVGDAKAVRDAASALLMLDPKHPARGEIKLATIALDPAVGAGKIDAQAETLGEDQRVRVLRSLIALLDADPDALGNSDRGQRVIRLLDLIPPGQRSAGELKRWMTGGRHDLETLVKEAERSGSLPLTVAAINRSFAADRYDLVKQLIPKLPPEQQRAASLAVAEYTWDTASLRALSNDPQAYRPRVVAPHLAFDHVAFHVSSPSGAIPRKNVYVKIDGQAVHGTAIRRFASLIMAPITPGVGEIRLEILLDEEVIFSEKVRK